jgi:hypothetical protein
MTLYALIFFLWNADGTVDLEIRRVKSCDHLEKINPEINVMCVKITVPKPGEPA